MVLSMLHAAEVVTTQQGNTAFGTYLADDTYRMPAAQEAWREPLGVVHCTTQRLACAMH